MKQFLILISLAVLFGAAQFANTYTDSHLIEGIVLDQDTGSPLFGVSVLEKGTTNGTNTDFDGRFSLTVTNAAATLVISYTGYQSKEITNITPGKEIKIHLGVNNMVLDEVVVTGKSRPRLGLGKVFKKDRSSAPATYHTAPYVNSHIPPSDPVDNWNTEDYALIQENRFLEVGQEPLSTFSIDVDAASYSNMRRFLKNGQTPPKDAVRIEEMVNYFDYEYPQPQGEHPFEVVTEFSDCPWQPKHQLLHVGLQGKEIPMENLPASNLVFLIDVSGSMENANKLPLLKSSFKLLTDQLREQDKVSIVVYAGAAGLVLEPTAGTDKRKIKDALSKLQAGGSTAGGAGIQLAYKTAREHFIEGGNNRVILATDGDFNIGASSDAELVRMIEKERESGVFLTVLGFGMGNYKDNKMQQLADKGNGNHAYIDDISEAQKVLVSEFGGTVFAIAKDVKIQIEFNPEHVQAYRLIGYENRMLENEDFNDDKKDAGELGSGHTVTALYEIIPSGTKSDFLADVDELKYQKENKPNAASRNSEELCTVKLRYKKPDGNVSQKIEHIVSANDIKEASDNFLWSAAVAEFGMLLRNSEYKSKANYEQVIQLAKKAKGKDENGYRQEFIKMAKTMHSLADPEMAGKE
ncbi:MAG: von Willebrand factor type A domain-containing protein [Chitinophagales bacterium]|nr:von Willebrand factor type A domain-containing protein [Chitinophagales bacterium]